MADQSETVDTTEEKTVRRRSRNACDACRSRKIKCIYDGSICAACLSLHIPCTYKRPRKRRGPLNQYVLAQSQNHTSPGTIESTSPDSIAPSGVERLAPFHVVERIIHDWFDLIHSVCPMFHRGIFLSRLAAGEAAHDGIFAALVISICAATITSLKRKSSKDYGTLTTEKCIEVAQTMESQMAKQPLTLEWCQMKYHLGISLANQRSFDDADSFRIIAEATAGVKYLTYYKMQEMCTVSQQLMKRLYWLLFAGLCTWDLHGRPYIGLLTPQDNIHSLTPLELSDNELDSTHVLNDGDWDGNTKSYIPGLNYLSKLFILWHQSQQGTNKTVEHFQHYTNLVHRALDYLPPELKWRGGLSRPPQSNFGTDVQMANLYITQLHIRSNLLEQMNRAFKNAVTPQTSSQIIIERQGIVEDMLEILYHMPQETLEANGHSLVPKIRDIGSALLDEVRTGGQSQGISPKASANLERLLAKLESLDVQPQLEFLNMGPLPDIQNT